MKNCLIVLVVLVLCVGVAFYLALFLNTSRSGGLGGSVATWQSYDEMPGYQVSITPEYIWVDELVAPTAKRYMAKGHWAEHAFYVDSSVDAPAQVAIAHELKNEDLEFDLGYFKPDRPGKITLVKSMRGSLEPSLYPTTRDQQTVTYPPPRGLISPGMLECDLATLPWHADGIESSSPQVNVDQPETLSDGKKNKDFLIQVQPDNSNAGTSIYTYHSDRPGVGKLLVSVYHGRVVEVTGGAEETSDIPWRAPEVPPVVESPEPPTRKAGWGEWLFDLMFKK